jgi:prepilin-type N-terminal cleavage/methylation domain-containing protein/prepilin-type processing-associated H-X9-DG protein
MGTNNRKRGRGFTLIELLVVIAIIAILAAILFPVLSAVKSRGQQAKCLGNLRQLAAALDCYASEYRCRVGDVPGGTGDGSWPYVEPNPGAKGPSDPGYAGGDARRCWIAHYATSAKIMKCPAEEGSVDVYTMVGWTGIRILHQRLTFAWNYTVNIGYGDPTFLRRPSRIPAWVEENTDSRYAVPTSREKYGNVINDMSFSGSDITSYRHRGVAVVSFADGHVGSVPGGSIQDSSRYPDGTHMFKEE